MYDTLTNRSLAQDGAPRWVMLKSVLDHFAEWAVRQSPYTVPDGLGEAVVTLRSELINSFDANGMIFIDGRKMESLIKDAVAGVQVIENWNRPKPGSHTIAFVSRHGGPHPDYDFIDLDALCRNVAFSVVREAAIEDGQDSAVA